MATIWTVRVVLDNPNSETAPTEPCTIAQADIFASEQEAIAAYSAKIKAGLPNGHKFVQIYLERADPIPGQPGKAHHFVKHYQFHLGGDGQAHGNDFSRIVEV